MTYVPIPDSTTRVDCGQCEGGHLRATYGSFQSDLICDRECGHRLNMTDLTPDHDERVAFDAQGFLTVTRYEWTEGVQCPECSGWNDPEADLCEWCNHALFADES